MRRFLLFDNTAQPVLINGILILYSQDHGKMKGLGCRIALYNLGRDSRVNSDIVTQGAGRAAAAIQVGGMLQ